MLFCSLIIRGAVYPSVLYSMMKYNDDKDAVAYHLPSVKKWLNWLDSLASKGVENMYAEYGDWVPPPDVYSK